MKSLCLAMLLIMAAACGNPAGLKYGTLIGHWRGPTTLLDGDEGSIHVSYGSYWGNTPGPVVPRSDGTFDAPGRWWSLNQWGQRSPDDPGSPVQFTGSLNVHTGRILLTVTDSLTGSRYVREWVHAYHYIPPPPPAPPPPP